MRIGNLLSCLVVGAVLVPASYREAKSDTLPAIGGRAWNPNETTCFYSSYPNAVGSACPEGTKTWLVPVQNRWTTGTRTFTAYSNLAAITAGASVKCEGIVASQSSSVIYLTGRKNVLSGGTTLGSTTLSSSNYSYQFICDLFVGAGVPIPVVELRVVRLT